MKASRIFIFFLVVTSILVTGIAWSKPGGNDDAPPPFDTNVVNTPDVNVVNTPDVNVVNFPQNILSPFSRSCTANDAECTIDFSALAEIGEVHITQASGQAQNVGITASPRFFNGGSPEVLMPPTVNTVDTGNDRDVVFSQSMDLIPVSSFIRFLEPQSSNVFFYIHGYVVTSASAAAAAEDAGVIFLEEGSSSP